MVCVWRHQKHDYASYDRFVPNFDMAYKTITHVSVPNLKSFRPTKTKLRAKEGGEFFIMLYGKMGWGRSFAYQHGCRNINVWKSSKFWTAITFAFNGVSTWNLQRCFKMGLFTFCKNFVQKISNLNFWWRHCKPCIWVSIFLEHGHLLLADEFWSTKRNQIRSTNWHKPPTVW